MRCRKIDYVSNKIDLIDIYGHYYINIDLKTIKTKSYDFCKSFVDSAKFVSFGIYAILTYLKMR